MARLAIVLVLELQIRMARFSATSKSTAETYAWWDSSVRPPSLQIEPQILQLGLSVAAVANSQKRETLECSQGNSKRFSKSISIVGNRYFDRKYSSRALLNGYLNIAIIYSEFLASQR